MRLLFYDTTKKTHYDFLQLIGTVRPHESFDARDKVYSLLSLCDAVTQTRMRPEYKASAAEAYGRLLAASVEVTQSLDILSCVVGHTRLIGLPTFIPDWTSVVLGGGLQATRLDVVFSGIYKPSRGSPAQFRMVRNEKAVTKCCILDTIRVIEEHKDDNSYLKRGSSAAQMSNFERIAKSRTSQESWYPRISSWLPRLDAFWRALCGYSIFVVNGPPPGSRRATTSDRPMHMNWYLHLSSSLDAETYAGESKAHWPVHATHGFTAAGRKFFVTGREFLGWVPLQAEVGDVVVVLPGGRVPYVLREAEPDLDTPPLGGENDSKVTLPGHTYRFVGDAYLQGFMDGEGYDEEKLVDITLI